MSGKRIAVAVLIPLGIAGIAGCGGAGETQSPTSASTADETVAVESTSADAPSPTPEPSPTDIPSPVETVAEATYVMTSTVDYAPFEGWDSLDEDGKLAVCTTFFEANGLRTPDPGEWTSIKGQDIVDFWDARYAIVGDVNADAHDGRNARVAMNLFECITSPLLDEPPNDVWGIWRFKLTDAHNLDPAETRGPEEMFRMYDFGSVTKVSPEGWWSISKEVSVYLVEVEGTSKYSTGGVPAKVQLLFDVSRGKGIRLSAFKNMTANPDKEDLYDWGARGQEPLIVEPTP